MEILRDIVDRSRKLNGTVVFAEGDEERTLAAAVRLAAEKVCRVVCVAPARGLMEKAAKKQKLDIRGVAFLKPNAKLISPRVLASFVRRRVERGASEKEARRLAVEPLHFSALYVASGRADAGIAGARSDSADVLRAALHGVGKAPGITLISSFFLMVPPENHPLISRPLIFADCAVNPAPAADGLKDIASESVESFKKIFPGETARVAFLSFSTKGSAEHPALKKIRDAAKAVRALYARDKRVEVDGEFQFDAAIVPWIGGRKAPGSPVAGRANILIFPDLSSGNIGYKITERLGLFTAIGPITQGLAKPMSDLSRGCSVSDIYYAAALTILKKK